MTLKTDTIKIVITEPELFTTLATFTENIEPVFIISGTKSQWILPEITSGVAVLLPEVSLKTDPFVLQHLKYESTANAIIYDGKYIGDLTAMKLVNLEITLVNTSGENLYTQLVIVSPNNDPLSLADLEVDATEAEAVEVVEESEIGDAADEGKESSQDEEDK